MHFPETMIAVIGSHKPDPVTDDHRSGDVVWRVGEDMILKYSKDRERLRREKVANEALALRNLSVSRCVEYCEDNEGAWYLKTAVQGNSLCSPEYLADPARLAKLLGQAVRMFHSADPVEFPLRNADSAGDTVIHGDFCLPNILAEGNRITGFIDTEASGLGDPWMDFAWAIWSFEYNLGTKAYTGLLLEELGIAFDKEKFCHYTDV